MLNRWFIRGSALAVASLAWFDAAGPVAAHGPVPAESPTIANLALGWTFEPLVAVPLGLLAAGWLILVDRVARRHPGNPVALRRSLAFIGGLVAIAVALLSGIGRYDTTLFSIHMVQHLVLVLVAAPLLVLAAPITQLLRASSPEVRHRWLLPILHSRAVAVAGHPVVAWSSFTAILWLSHFSPLFDVALENQAVHDLEHALYLGSALLFWWPVIGADPAPRRMSHPARIGYVLLQMPFSSFLAMAVLFTDAPLYRHYATLGAPYGITALADQQQAAGIMWLISDAIFIAAIMVIVAVWMRHEDRDAPAADRRADAARAALRERADRLAERRAATGEGPR